MRSRVTHAAWGTLRAAIATLAALALSCAQSPTGPTSVAELGGTVLDSGGRAVAGARVVVSYPYPDPVSPSPSASQTSALMGTPVPVPLPSARTLVVFNNPCSLGVVTFRFGLPDTARATGEIVDRDGKVRKHLLERMCMPGTFAILWDGKDDLDSLLAPDVYAIHLDEVQGDSTFHLTANVLWDPSDPTAFYAIRANTQGAFSIPLSALPIGQRIDAVDIGGSPLGSFMVGKSLRVTATGPAGGIASIASAVVPVHAAGKSLSVVVRLP